MKRNGESNSHLISRTSRNERCDEQSQYKIRKLIYTIKYNITSGGAITLLLNKDLL